MGSSYYHAPSGVTFESLARGGTSPNEWIDVRITFLPLLGFEDSLIEVDEQAGVGAAEPADHPESHPLRGGPLVAAAFFFFAPVGIRRAGPT